MLTHLRIVDFALLDDVEVEFCPGLNVLTGETGAGKSLLVEAVALLRGGRAASDLVQSGAEEALLEALFEPPHGPAAEALAERLENIGIAAAEEGLVVRRLIGRSGRGRVYVNNTLVTAAALEELTGVLIELAGQHQHQTLSRPGEHLRLLDGFAGHAALVAQAGAAYARLKQAQTAVAAASSDERTRAERADLLSFQLGELREARLEPGEQERLLGERERLRHAATLEEAARRGEDALYAREGAITEELAALGVKLAELARIDTALAPLSRQIDEARLLLEDAAGELRRYAERLESDPERLAAVEARLHTIERLGRKHGGVAAALERERTMTEELEHLSAHEEQKAKLDAELETARREALSVAEQLTQARQKAAVTLGGSVSRALGELGMAGARLRPEVAPQAAREGDEPAFCSDGRRLGPLGWDRVEFLLATNPGEELRPLRRIASGGELSRIMLALKQILARADQVATYVFDEVDAGIGGALADKVGQRIRAVAADKQVLCITHLPQIAAYADAHFRVEKTTHAGRARTLVRRLPAAERRDEIARMLGGAKVTVKARAHAEEMLKAAR